VGDDKGAVWIANANVPKPTLTRLPGEHVGPVRALTSVAIDGGWLIASAGHDRKIRVRGHNDDEAYVLAGEEHRNRVLDLRSLETSEGTILLSAGVDGAVQYWDPIDARASTQRVWLGKEQINVICPFTIGTVPWVASGADNGEVECWPLRTSDERTLLPRAGTEGVVGLAWIALDRGGLLAVLTNGGLLELWDITARSLAARVRVGEHGLALTTTPSPRTVVVAYDAAWITLRVRQT
jgi:WD40 repeat protein